jgi:hypothetical protein
MSFVVVQEFLFCDMGLGASLVGVVLAVFGIMVAIKDVPNLSARQRRNQRLVVGTVGILLVAVIAAFWVVVLANGGWPYYRTGMLIGAVAGGFMGWLLNGSEN